MFLDIAHHWGVEAAWGPTGLLFTKKRVSQVAGPPKYILVYRSGLAGVHVIALSSGFANSGFKIANERPQSSDGLTACLLLYCFLICKCV